MRYYAVSLAVVCLAAAQTPLEHLTAREAVDLAARTNPRIQLSLLKSLESKAAGRIAASAFKPQAEAVAGFASQTNNLRAIGLSIPGFTDRLGPYRLFNARPVISQAVIDLPLLSRIRAARQRTSGAELDASAVREEVQALVLELYVQVFQARSQRRAAEARLETADAVLDQTRKLSTSGEGSKLDVARVRQQREEEALHIIAAQEEEEILKTTLLEAIGLVATASIELAPPPEPASPSSSPDELVSDAVSARSDVKALEARIRAARQEETAAERERLPKVGVMADYGLLGAGPDRALSTYNAGVSLRVPLSTGGRIKAEMQAAALQRAELELELKRLKLAVTRRLASARIAFDAERQASKAAENFAEAARTALELVRVRLGAGLATSLDVVTAQGRLTVAEEARINAHFGAMIARVRWAEASGNILRYFD